MLDARELGDMVLSQVHDELECSSWIRADEPIPVNLGFAFIIEFGIPIGIEYGLGFLDAVSDLCEPRAQLIEVALHQLLERLSDARSGLVGHTFGSSLASIRGSAFGDRHSAL